MSCNQDAPHTNLRMAFGLCGGLGQLVANQEAILSPLRKSTLERNPSLFSFMSDAVQHLI